MARPLVLINKSTYLPCFQRFPNSCTTLKRASGALPELKINCFKIIGSYDCFKSTYWSRLLSSRTKPVKNVHHNSMRRKQEAWLNKGNQMNTSGWNTFRCGKSCAVFQSLSSLIRVTRGNLIDIPSAVCVDDLLNSAPVISHTGAFWRKQKELQKRRITSKAL